MSIERVKALALWRDLKDITPLHGGLSNENFLVQDGKEKFVVRLGCDYPFHHVSREREAQIADAAFTAGFAPEVIYCEPGVMVCRFIESRTYDGEDVRENIIRVSEITRAFHTTMPQYISGTAVIFWVFHVIRDYARTLAAGNSRMAEALPGYLELATEMEAAQVALPIIFGHHDLLPANFLDDGTKLWLIDFEYGGFGTAMFDLAGIASNAEFSPEQTEELLATYFATKPDEHLLRAHGAMQCASLLREAMWSMVSEIHLETPGVDFTAYTTENLNRLDLALEYYRSRFGKECA